MHLQAMNRRAASAHSTPLGARWSHACREGEEKSFFEVMVRAREKEEIVVGLKPKGHKSPQLNPKGKAEQNLSLKTVSSFVVILTGAHTA